MRTLKWSERPGIDWLLDMVGSTGWSSTFKPWTASAGAENLKEAEKINCKGPIKGKR
jgi:hypothetical protein